MGKSKILLKGGVKGQQVINIDEYYSMSLSVANDIPVEINNFFSEYGTDPAFHATLSESMEDWLKSAKERSSHADAIGYSLQTLVFYILTSGISYPVPRDRRNELRKSRRDRLDYLLSVIKKERKDEYAKGMIHDDYANYRFLVQVDSDLVKDKKGLSEEEYCTKAYGNVIRWGKEKDHNLIGFPYFRVLSIKRQVSYFLLDLSFHVFDIIDRDYYGNPTGGNITMAPPYAVNGGMFRLSAHKEDLTVAVEGGEINAFSERTVHTGKGSTKLKTIVDSRPLPVGTDKNADELIKELIDSGSIAKQSVALDARDRELFVHLFSSYNIEEANRGIKTFMLSDLVGSVSAKKSKDSYIETALHLNRLNDYRVQYTGTNEAGEVVESGTMTFFDIVYRFDSKNGGPVTYNAKITTSNDRDGLMKLFEDCDDFSKISVDVMPSMAIKQGILSQMNTMVYTNIYNKIAPPQAKYMLMYLQNQRSQIYPETTAILLIRTVANQLGIDYLKKNQQTRSIREQLILLMDASVVVKDFHMDGDYISVDFLPFTEDELEAYHIRKP